LRFVPEIVAIVNVSKECEVRNYTENSDRVLLAGGVERFCGDLLL
jgi:hypothetical protein